jgi:hypothetical protein
MKTIITLFLFVPLFCFSQKVKIYNTEESYKEKKPSAIYDEFYKVYGTNGTTVVFLENGEHMFVKCETIWGFENEDQLYRIDADNNQPVALYYEGTLTVWAPGGEMLYYQKYPGGNYPRNVDLNIKNAAYGYISETLYSPIIELRGKLKETKTELGKFRATNNKYEEIFSCPNPAYMWMAGVVADCVKEFDKKKK